MLCEFSFLKELIWSDDIGFSCNLNLSQTGRSLELGNGLRATSVPAVWSFCLCVFLLCLFVFVLCLFVYVSFYCVFLSFCLFTVSVCLCTVSFRLSVRATVCAVWGQQWSVVARLAPAETPTRDKQTRAQTDKNKNTNRGTNTNTILIFLYLHRNQRLGLHLNLLALVLQFNRILYQVLKHKHK